MVHPQRLAHPKQVGEENVLTHQGTDNLFIVHDPHPEASGDCKQAPEPPFDAVRDVKYRGVCKPDQEQVVESIGRYGTPVGADGTACLPSACCDVVAHLCGIKLCDVIELDGRKVRGSPTKLKEEPAKNGARIPDCVPFEIPQICCEPYPE